VTFSDEEIWDDYEEQTGVLPDLELLREVMLDEELVELIELEQTDPYELARQLEQEELNEDD
jgi:hypothetical protein